MVPSGRAVEPMPTGNLDIMSVVTANIPSERIKKFSAEEKAILEELKLCLVRE
jgi:hypothetical protein